MASELKSDLLDTTDWDKKQLVYFYDGKNNIDLFDRSDNSGAIDVKMDGSVLEEKSSFKILRVSFSSKLDWGFYILSIVKTAFKKLKPLFFLWRFFLLTLLFISIKLLYTYIKWTCMEYRYFVWAGCSSCYLDIWDKLQKWICRTSLATTLDWNLSSLPICSQGKSFL